MAGRSLSRVVAALLVLCAATTAEGASLRCKGGVVTHGDSVEVVRRKCGDPDHTTGYQRRTESRIDRRPGAFNLTDVETWTYRRGYGRFVQNLTFEGGLLIRIDRGPRQE
jgi:hypothetical protein